MSWIIDRKDDQKYQGDGAKPVTVEQYFALLAGKSVEVSGETWTADDGPFYVPDENLIERGGEGSGHHGHKGRPGEVGGSLPIGAKPKRPESDFDPETIVRADRMPGMCYEASARWFIMDQGTSIPNAKLVHGTVGGQGHIAGKRFTHAWVEIDDAWVYDRTQDLIMPKDEYYQVGVVEDMVSYEPDEVRVKLLQTKHWGPWEDFLLGYKELEAERHYP